jgi:hypothetical protein
MNRIIIMAKNRHFPKSISVREAITLHQQATEALHQINNQPLAGAALAASAQEEQP